MTSLSRIAWLAVALAALSSVGCTVSRHPLGGQCELNTECQDPLVCRLERCRLECASVRDCPPGALCARDENGVGACLLPDEEVCARDDECAGVLRCLGNTCSEECAENRDCAPGARCVCAPGMTCDDEAMTGQKLCVNPSGEACGSSLECGEELVCGDDGRCRPQCSTNRDCALGTVCENGLCALVPGHECVTPADCMGLNVETASCVIGRCELGCASGFGDCDGVDATGCETRLGDDPSNCGGCGVSCGIDVACTAGICDGSPAVHVEVDERNFCVTRASGTTYCMGDNIDGQLGRGSSGGSEAALAPFQDAMGPISLTSIAVAPGIACGIRTGSGEVVCAGDNANGAVGMGMGTIRMPAVVMVPQTVMAYDPMVSGEVTLTGITQLVAGGMPGITGEHRAFVCARNDTKTWCWGYAESNAFVDFSGDISWAQEIAPAFTLDIAAGSVHGCLIEESGTRPVMCWGPSGNRLGPDPHSLGVGLASPVPDVFAWQLDAAETYNCAVTYAGGAITGRVVCWGDGDFGQLGGAGPGITPSSATPVEVDGLTDATFVDVGNLHACALREGGGVRCWGSNADERLGDGTDESVLGMSHIPVDVVGLTATSISVGGVRGGAGACAIRTDGAVVCWGGTAADYGVVGDTTSWPTPTVHPSFPPTSVVP